MSCRTLSGGCGAGSRMPRNGLGVKITALVDTGADGYAFIDRTYARLGRDKLGLREVQLAHTTPMRDYQGRPGTPVSSPVVANL